MAEQTHAAFLLRHRSRSFVVQTAAGCFVPTENAPHLRIADYPSPVRGCLPMLTFEKGCSAGPPFAALAYWDAPCPLRRS